MPIPHDQVTTQPSLCAMLIAALRLDGTQQVLEVGTGYGYPDGAAGPARRPRGQHRDLA